MNDTHNCIQLYRMPTPISISILQPKWLRKFLSPKSDGCLNKWSCWYLVTRVTWRWIFVRHVMICGEKNNFHRVFFTFLRWIAANYLFSAHSRQSPHFLQKFPVITAFLTKVHRNHRISYKSSPQSPHFLQKFTAITAFLTKVHPKTSTRKECILKQDWYRGEEWPVNVEDKFHHILLDKNTEELNNASSDHNNVVVSKFVNGKIGKDLIDCLPRFFKPSNSWQKQALVSTIHSTQISSWPPHQKKVKKVIWLIFFIFQHQWAWY